MSMELEHNLDKVSANSVRGNDNGSIKPLKTEEELCVSLFQEGVSLLISQWTTAQEFAALDRGMSAPLVKTYVRTCQWRVESKKLDKLANRVFAWFTTSKEPCDNIDKLAIHLCDSIMLYFGETILEDRSISIDPTADRLINLHKEYLQGKCESNVEKLNDTIEKLRQSAHNGAKFVDPSIWKNHMIEQENFNKTYQNCQEGAAGILLEKGLEEAFKNSVRIGAGDSIMEIQPSKALVTEEEWCVSLFTEGISLIISQWTVFQEMAALTCGLSERNMAHYVRTRLWRVQSEEEDQFTANIFTWFTESNEPREDVKELEKFLCDLVKRFFKLKMIRFANVIETANRLMNLYKEFLMGKCDSNNVKLRETIEKLRQSPYNGARLLPPSIWKRTSRKVNYKFSKEMPRSMKVRKEETKKKGSHSNKVRKMKKKINEVQMEEV